ncbi:MAG: hypothetical protein EAZ24_05730 [Burkholderiales bacterium]|nr:MAG: hypothetical protein EAZ24_05730 [Burkholderiales bacterium]TAG79950.1 MAG: hypothetical protein EAZ21_09280 [Betaproteobacteria bacterium]
MTASKFRLIIWLYVALAFASIGAAFLPNSFSPELVAAYENEPLPWDAENEWALIVFAVLMLVAWIAAFVGLLLLKRWGRTLALYITALTLIASPTFGPTLSTGLETALIEAAAIYWGAVLAIAYYSDVRGYFQKREI